MKKDKQSIAAWVLAAVVMLLSAVVLPPLFKPDPPAEAIFLPVQTVWEPVEIRLDLNTATEEELICLPGIGPVTAQSILDRRCELGAFRSREDVLSVPGIGEATLQKIEPYIRY